MVVVSILSLCCCGDQAWSPILVREPSPKDVLLKSTLTPPFPWGPSTLILFGEGVETGREGVVGVQGFYFKSYFF